MDALSPRSTNVPVRIKDMMKKAKHVQPVATATKAQKGKDHASPPPAEVREPGPGGERYQIGALLGKGGFAICHEGKLRRNSRVFALKVVKSNLAQPKMEEKFRTELQIHCKMGHPNIVEFYRAFAFKETTYVVLQLCPNGSIMDMVKKRRCLSLPEVRRFIVQLCGAVRYMHHRNVAHRDLKMGNLFLDDNMNLKVGDFGLAAVIRTTEEAEAPEVLEKSHGGHDEKVDIWAIGIICFAMLTGFPPFQSTTQKEIYSKVKDLKYMWPKDSDCANYIPSEAKSFVSSCLRLNAEQRPEANDLVEHPFLQKAHGIPKQLDPTCRFLKPTWLKSQDPRGDSMEDGHSLEFDDKYSSMRTTDPDQQESWYLHCLHEFLAECGVGRMPSGIGARPLVGNNTEKTAYAECNEEGDLGKAPVVPMPENAVYKYHIDSGADWSIPSEYTKEEVGHFGISIMKSTSSNDDAKSVASDAASIRSVSSGRSQSGEALLTRTRSTTSIQSRNSRLHGHAAMLRQQSRPTGASRQDVAEPRCGITASERPDEIASSKDQSRGLLSEQPVRQSSRATLRSTLRRPQKEESVRQTRSSQEATEDVTAKPDQTTQKAGTTVSHPSDKALLAKEREKAVVQNVLILTGQADPRQMMQEKQGKHFTQEAAAQVKKEHQDLMKGDLPKKTRSVLCEAPLINDDEVVESIPGTAPAEVMSSLKLLYATLKVPVTTKATWATSNPTPSQNNESTSIVADEAKTHALVVKWVDYTNRYGIGYILNDGTVGCVFKGENEEPSSCIVVRGGEQHLRKRQQKWYTERHQMVDRNGQAVEFFENHPTEGVKRVYVEAKEFDVSIDKGGNSAMTIGSLASKAKKFGQKFIASKNEKNKRVKLTHSFGRYMTNDLGSGSEHAQSSLVDYIPSNHGGGPFVKFYQRAGNVGIWGFGDGAYQFNFPDHTKIVISADGMYVDFYHLQPSDALALQQSNTHTIDTTALENRRLLSLPTRDMKRGRYGSHKFQSVLTSNQFERKIIFILDVIGRWIENGRLGDIGEGVQVDGVEGRLPDLVWDGNQEGKEGKVTKMVWVTVGAHGGDMGWFCAEFGAVSKAE